MLTIETIYSQLDESLNINNVNSVFSRDYLIDLVNQQRELWLRNEYNKSKRTIDPYIIQDLGCVPLELVSAIDCCENIPLDCIILRSKCKIPNTIEFYDSKAITSVGPIDITKKRFNIIDYKRVPFTGEGKFTYNQVYSFLYNDYIYIYSKNSDINLLEFVNIRGVFSNPLEASTLCLCNNTNDPSACIDETAKYPLNMWMWEYIRPIIVKELLQKQGIPQDQNNNNKDDKTELNVK